MSINDEDIDKLEQQYSGNKPIKDPADLVRAHKIKVIGNYLVQLAIEFFVLRKQGLSWENCIALIQRWGWKKWDWLKRILSDQTPLTICWGAASDTLANRKDTSIVCELISLLMEGVAREGGSIEHGSSTTGFMGIFDWFFTKAAESILGAAWRTIVHIYTLSLHWISSAMRETPSKNGDPEDRNSPNMCLGDRTSNFFPKRPRRILVAPGGFGTYFEIFFILMHWQLRKLLFTVCSAWEQKVPMFILDFAPELTEEELQFLGTDHPEVVSEARSWYFNGLFGILLKGVLLGAFKQEDLECVYIIRIDPTGTLKDYDGPVGQHKGARTKYFRTTKLANEFIFMEEHYKQAA